MHHGHLFLLARSSDYRYIARCEHGTIHLRWDNATFHIRPADFDRIVRLLEKGCDSRCTRLCDPPICLIQGENGCVHLLIKDIGLYLRPADFLIFVDMAQVAVQRLADQAWETDHQDHPEVRISPGISFSLN